MKCEVNLSITWKLHILFVHVEQFLQYLPKYGLGTFSEQVTASLKPSLQRFKNRKANDLNAIINFCSKNLN